MLTCNGIPNGTSRARQTTTTMMNAEVDEEIIPKGGIVYSMRHIWTQIEYYG